MQRRGWARSAVLLSTLAVGLGACSSGSKHSSAKPGSTTTTVDTRPQVTIPETAWSDVATGTFRSQPWTVAYARSSDGWRCYDPQGSALPSASAPSSPTGATKRPPTRQGRTTACLAPNAPAGPVRFTAFVAGADAAQWELIGAVADGVSRVHIVFHDGTTTALDIDPHTRIIEWKGPASLRPTELRTDSTACTLDTAAARPNETLCAGVTG